MPINTSVAIKIDGEDLTRFSRLVIDQKVHTHHRFSLLQPLPKEFIEEAIKKAQGYIGKTINISITATNMSAEAPLNFNGVITETQLVRTAGASGGIIINGFSPTILMEGPPNIRSFNDMTLTDIVNDVMKSYPSGQLKPSVDIQKDSTLPYTVQYAESDFAFICRMAQKKGQWLYFNGEELQFGKPKSKTYTLEYGRTLHSFNIEMRAKSLGFEYIGYDASNGDTQKANSSEAGYQAQGYAKEVFDASKKMFPNTSTLLYSNALEEGNSKSHLTERVSMQLKSRAADLVTAKGDSDETGLRPGDIVVVKEPSFSLTGISADSIKEQSYGNYLITDITHICDESGNYHNTFDAVPDTVEAPPYGNVHSIPMAESQPATIIDNNDPSGLGRVKVAFAWQKDKGGNSPWVRMINPHSGNGKGFYFIPEVGEEVLVGFEGGNAEKPFVLGSMYNGSGKSGQNDSSNNFKAIQTRGGHLIRFDDTDGAESITISDKNGNTVVLNTNEKSITINAPERIDFISKEINIIGENNVNVSSKATAIDGSDSVSISSNTQVEAGAPSLSLTGEKDVSIDGMQVNVNGSVTTNVKGTILNLN
ncbi:hypothetical protein AMR72_02830 [Flavobacterium psychrophilum]|nr:hypothetical protein AMR72_02830 [Flavobacterium psychrophilum]AOE51540.1 hypothetical protein ALW18_02830 [Flavobacterium psychrophilum]